MKNVAIVAGLGTHINRSGMISQALNIHESFKNNDVINLHLLNSWDQHPYDIYHIFGCSEDLFFFIVQLKLRQKKVVLSPNAAPSFSPLVEKLLSRIGYKHFFLSKRYLIKKNLIMADVVVVNSSFEMEKLSTSYGVPKKKFKIIYNSYGKLPSISKKSFREKHTFNGEYCLSVGQVGSKRKNHLALINAWSDDFPMLLIIGDIANSSYGKECRRISSRKKNITFLGFEKDQDVIDSAIASSQLLISPGLIETPSLVAMRGVLMGNQVLSTSGGATREYFGDLVAYCNPTDEKDIQRAVSECLKDPKFIENTDFIYKFSTETIGNEYFKVYADLH